MIWGAIWLLVAGFVTKISWRTPMRLVGLGLAIASMVTTATFYATDFAGHVVVEIILAVCITAIAACAWCDRGGRPYQIVIALAALDTMFTGAICALGSESGAIQFLFAIVTNLIFAGQCVCVAAPGVRDAIQNWIRAVDRRRDMDSAHPDCDWLLRRLDRFDQK